MQIALLFLMLILLILEICFVPATIISIMELTDDTDMPLYQTIKEKCKTICIFFTMGISLVAYELLEITKLEIRESIAIGVLGLFFSFMAYLLALKKSEAAKI